MLSKIKEFILFVPLALLVFFYVLFKIKKDENIKLKKHIKAKDKAYEHNLKVKEFNTKQVTKKQVIDEDIQKFNKKVKEDEKVIDTTDSTLTI